MDELGLQGGNEALRHGALSRAVPVLPIEGTMPTSARRLPKEIAVYWAPRSERCTSPADGLRLQSAISSASTTSSVLMWFSIAHPTILLEWVSRMKARYRKPSCVGTYVMSASQTLLWPQRPRSPREAGPGREQPADRGGWFYASCPSYSPGVPQLSSVELPSCDRTLLQANVTRRAPSGSRKSRGTCYGSRGSSR
jgi:hypothetical protein